MTTFEIIQQLQSINLMREAVDEETGEFLFTVEEVEAEEKKINATKEEKLNAIQDYKLSLNDEIARFKEKKAKQDANIKRTTARQDYLKELQSELLGGEKLKTDEYSFYYTKSESVEVTDESQLLDKYFKVEKKPIAKDIKKAYKEAEAKGETFYGVILHKKTSLVVK